MEGSGTAPGEDGPGFESCCSAGSGRSAPDTTNSHTASRKEI